MSTLHKAHLPPGWNGSQDVCSLQYRHVASEQTCLVKAIPLGAQQLISAVVGVVLCPTMPSCCNMQVNSQMDNVISLTLTPSKYVKDGSSYDSPRLDGSVVSCSIRNSHIQYLCQPSGAYVNS